MQVKQGLQSPKRRGNGSSQSVSIQEQKFQIRKTPDVGRYGASQFIPTEDN
jgi:hypothetical protein